MYVKIGDKEVECAPGFQLFLHTKLSNPHYPPEIQAETTSKLLSHFPLQHPACREGRSPRHERAAGPGPRGPGPRPAAGPGLPGQGAGPAQPPRPAPWRPLQPPSGGPGGMLLRHLTQPGARGGLRGGRRGEDPAGSARQRQSSRPSTDGGCCHPPTPSHPWPSSKQGQAVLAAGAPPNRLGQQPAPALRLLLPGPSPQSPQSPVPRPRACGLSPAGGRSSRPQLTAGSDGRRARAGRGTTAGWCGRWRASRRTSTGRGRSGRGRRARCWTMRRRSRPSGRPPSPRPASGCRGASRRCPSPSRRRSSGPSSRRRTRRRRRPASTSRTTTRRRPRSRRRPPRRRQRRRSGPRPRAGGRHRLRGRPRRRPPRRPRRPSRRPPSSLARRSGGRSRAAPSRAHRVTTPSRRARRRTGTGTTPPGGRWGGRGRRGRRGRKARRWPRRRWTGRATA